MSTEPNYVTICCVEVSETTTKGLGNPKTGKAKKKFPGTYESLCPPFDTSRKEIRTGVSREDFAKLFPDKNYDTYFSELRHTFGPADVRLDISSPHNLMVYNAIVKQSPKIAKDKNSVNTAIHTWYIKDEREEANKMMTNFEIKKKAYDLFEKLSPEERKKILATYAVRVRTIGGDTHSAKLLEFLENNPTEFVKKCEDPQRELTSFFYLALEQGLKNLREERGHYYWGETSLGPSIQAAVLKLSDPLNQDILLQMKNEYMNPEG